MDLDEFTHDELCEYVREQKARADKAEAVVAQVREYAFTVCDPYLPETVGLRRLLDILDAAAPEGEKESDGR